MKILYMCSVTNFYFFIIRVKLKSITGLSVMVLLMLCGLKV
jgi:hypothetical protein